MLMSGHALLKGNELLAALPYFQNLDAATLQAVMQAAVRRTYETNQALPMG
jgi:hypothetical protein